MTPMDVHNLGKKQLAILYPLVSITEFLYRLVVELILLQIGQIEPELSTKGP